MLPAVDYSLSLCCTDRILSLLNEVQTHTPPSPRSALVSQFHCGYISRTGLAEMRYRKMNSAMDVWCLPKPIFTPLFVLLYKEFWQRWRKCCVKKGSWNGILLSVFGNFANCLHCQRPPLVRTEGWSPLSSPAYLLCIILLDSASSSWHSLCFFTNKDDSLLTESYQGSEGNEVQSMFSGLEQSTNVGRTCLS